MKKQKLLKRNSPEGIALASKMKKKQKVTKEFRALVNKIMDRYDEALRALANM